MYAAEKLENFRWISKIVATYSPYTLTDSDLAPVSLHGELAEIGKSPNPTHLAGYLVLPLCRSIRGNRVRCQERSY